MFRAVILPIFRSTRLCYSLWYNAPTMLPAGDGQHRGFIIPQAVTHSLVLLKMGKIIARNMLSCLGIINKPLLLHLVGCLYYLYQWCKVKQISGNEIYLLIKYIKSVLRRAAKRLSYIEDARCLKVNKIFNLFNLFITYVENKYWFPFAEHGPHKLLKHSEVLVSYL
jgi:hypothetical protein